MLQTARDILSAGGWVMYPLLALSLISATLTFERLLFWAKHRAGASASLLSKLREAGGDRAKARRSASESPTVYGRFASVALAGESSGAEAHDLQAALDTVRPSIERFGATMSAVITGAPMMGILGTVIGIIESFRLLGAEGPVTDPTQIAGGIAQALYTTAFGLVIALLTLFPHAIFRARSERCLDQLEVIGAVLAAPTKSDD